MPSWVIVSKQEASQFIRVALSEVQDIWYDMAVGLIEEHTGWTLTAESSITERVDGLGTDYFELKKYPIASVTSVTLQGSAVNSNYYNVEWDKVRLYSYRGEDLTLYTGLYSLDYFPYGSGNLTVVYNAGGYASLPNRYLQAVKACILMVCKEFSTNFRGEGSDQMYRKYRPDRTQNPEEVLMSYGQHGKITGILKAFLPRKRQYA